MFHTKMSSTHDVGISPVLLQAISQSLSSTSPKQTSAISSKMEGSGSAPVASGAADQGLAEKLLKQKQDQVSVTQTPRESTKVPSDTIKTMLKIKMAADALTKAYATERKDEKEISGSSASDIAMANVLTALAYQGKAFITPSLESGTTGVLDAESDTVAQTSKTNESEYRAVQVGDKKILIRTKPNTETSVVEQQMIAESKDTGTADGTDETVYTAIKHEPGVENVEPLTLQSNDSNMLVSASSLQTNTNGSVELEKSNIENTVIISDNQVSQNESVVTCPEMGTKTQLVFSFNPTPSTSEIPMEGRYKVIEHEGKRYILQTHEYDSPQVAVSQTDEPHAYTVQIGTDDGITYTSVAEQEVVTVGQQQDDSGPIPAYKNPAATPCPVCGDNVSGFHYGIFTCESCKGFFKRTVQNKKTFVCPRNGECEIMLENRKKCPACRFAKCLVMGMKLEAIRLDRTRGGRSSYGGSSPYEDKKKRPIKIIQRRPSLLKPNESALASVLNSGGMHPEKPYVPQILTDIMNLESLLCDDDIPSSISAEDFSASNPNVFLTLLQLCELKLYKIVRWARNLPYFANISTDDQILLLQNCWCELLALTLCWKSLQLTSEIIFFHGQAIDHEKACSLDLGEMFTKMLAIIEQFRRLKIDQYECVALKVIILICPDIKGLNDADKLSEQQQRVSMALESYTSSHYTQSPNKYGEILLRLPELSKVSYMLKEHLMNWMPPNTTSCGLLYELLKGENMKDLM